MSMNIFMNNFGYGCLGATAGFDGLIVETGFGLESRSKQGIMSHSYVQGEYFDEFQNGSLRLPV